MAKKEFNLDNLMSLGIDSCNRRLYCGDCTVPSDEDSGEISTRSIERIVRALHQLVNEDPQKPIELYMSSGGGDPYAMLRLYDEILACPCPVRFIGGGIIQSSATWIMCACDERLLFPNTTIMVHDGTESVKGNHTDTKIAMAEAVRLQDMLCEVYAANSKMPKSFWQEICQRDLFISAEEAIKLGLADGLINPKNRTQFRQMRQANLDKMLSVVDQEALINQLFARINLRHKP